MVRMFCYWLQLQNGEGVKKMKVHFCLQTPTCVNYEISDKHFQLFIELIHKLDEMDKKTSEENKDQVGLDEFFWN